MIHKAQGLRLEQGVVDFDLEKAKIVCARADISFSQ